MIDKKFRCGSCDSCEEKEYDPNYPGYCYVVHLELQKQTLIELLKGGHEMARNLSISYGSKDDGTKRASWLNTVRKALRKIGSPLADG